MHFSLYISILLISILTSIILIPLCKKMITDGGHLRENYKAEKIPTSMGVVFVLNTWLILFGLFFISYTLNPSLFDRFEDIFLYQFMFISIIGFFGLLDDILGKNDKKGFKGHFKELFKGRLTSGMLKATNGFLVCILFTIFLTGIWNRKLDIEFLVNIFVIALSINFFNLLDLRPGRVLKVYFLTTIIVFFFTNKWIETLGTSSIILGSVLVYSFYDFRGKAMMGDVGSNILGFVIGVLIAINYSVSIKLFILLFLILIHIWCEFYSLSELIEKNRVLRFLDRLGTIQGKEKRC